MRAVSGQRLRCNGAGSSGYLQGALTMSCPGRFRWHDEQPGRANPRSHICSPIRGRRRCLQSINDERVNAAALGSG
jgi:hypothetical protein